MSKLVGTWKKKKKRIKIKAIDDEKKKKFKNKDNGFSASISAWNPFHLLHRSTS